MDDELKSAISRLLDVGIELKTETYAGYPLELWPSNISHIDRWYVREGGAQKDFDDKAAAIECFVDRLDI